MKILKFDFSFLLKTLLSFLTLLSCVVLAQKNIPDYTNYYQRSLTLNDEINEKSVTSFAQTNNGYLWIGTTDGLFNFDGLELSVYETNEIKNKNISCLFSDKNGVLWIGTTNSGVIKLYNGISTIISTKDGLSNNNIRAIAQDLYGNIWVGTDYGLNRINGSGIKVFNTHDGFLDNIITSITTDLYGNLWIGTLRGGVVKFNNRVLKLYLNKNQFSDELINCIQADDFGNIWIGTNKYLYRLDHLSERVKRVKEIYNTPIISLTKDNYGAVIAVTKLKGLYSITDKKITKISSGKYSRTDYLSEVFFTKNDNCFVGTSTQGFFELKEKAVTKLLVSNKIINDKITAFLLENENSLWIGTENNGLLKFNNEKILRIDSSSGLENNSINSLYKGRDGFLWTGTDHGLNKIKLSGKVMPLNLSITTRNKILSISENEQGNILVGSTVGLSEISKDGTQYANYLENDIVRVIFKKNDKQFLIGTNKGLYKFSNSQISKIILFKDETLHINSICEGENNFILLGTSNSGLIGVSASNFKKITIDNGLLSNNILGVIKDDNGFLWLSSPVGLIKIHIEEINDFLLNKTNRISATLYNDEIGKPRRFNENLGNPVIAKNSNADILFESNRGISIVSTKNIKINNSASAPIIKNVFINNKRSSIESPVVLSTDDTLGITFTAIDFTDPYKLTFRYKIDGYSSDYNYVFPGQDRFVQLSHLKEGNYNFILEAANNDNIWSKKYSLLAITIIDDKWFESSTFIIIICVVSIVILVIGYYTFYQKKNDSLGEKSNKYSTSSLDKSKTDTILPQLKTLMEEEKLFYEPELKLSDLASRLKIHSNHLSQIINEQFGMSYNDFINKYRIEEVKEKFLNKEYSGKTILEIMYETGFYSKSVFNSAFKKFTGTTPSKFRRSNNID